MKSLNLCGNAVFGIAISEVLSITSKPDTQHRSVRVTMDREHEQAACLKNIRFTDPKSGVVLGELLNAYHEEHA